MGKVEKEKLINRTHRVKEILCWVSFLNPTAKWCQIFNRPKAAIDLEPYPYTLDLTPYTLPFPYGPDRTGCT